MSIRMMVLEESRADQESHRIVPFVKCSQVYCLRIVIFYNKFDFNHDQDWRDWGMLSGDKNLVCITSTSSVVSITPLSGASYISYNVKIFILPYRNLISLSFSSYQRKSSLYNCQLNNGCKYRSRKHELPSVDVLGCSEAPFIVKWQRPGVNRNRQY